MIRDIGRKKWWAMGALALAAIAFSLDLTVLNLALPSLATDLHATTSQLQWIVDVYALMLATLTLPAGLLGDRFGRKKFLLGALALFGIASAVCAFSDTINLLIAGRIALGIGGAFILPLVLSMLPVFFNNAERPKAIGLVMGGVFLAYPLGPILGGWLLTHYHWGSVFLINVPIVALALLAVAWLLPESRGQHSHRIDFTGIALSSLGLAGLTFGAIQAESKGWGSALVVISLAVGAVLAASFIAWERYLERTHRDPLIDLNLFRSAGFAWGTLLMTIVNFAMFGLLFGLPQYFQSVQGHDPLGSGYRLLSMIGGLMVGLVLATALAKKLGSKYLVALGFGLMAAGLMLGTRTAVHSSDVFLLAWVGLTGLGLGFVTPSTANAALGALSEERSSSGSALMTAIRQVGSTLGVAVLGSALGSTYRSQLHLSALPDQIAETVRSSVVGGTAVARQLQSSELLYTVQTAFVHGLSQMLWVCAAIALVAVLLTLGFLPNYRPKATKKNDKQPIST